MSDRSSDDSPTIMTRLVEEAAAASPAAVDTFGSACAWVSRSCTIWRARRRSVPGSKIISIDDSPGTDSERISSSQATPLSRSASSGHRDELLDLVRGQAERLGLDLDVGRGELGQHVDRHGRQTDESEPEHPCSDGRDEQPESQAPTHQP